MCCWVMTILPVTHLSLQSVDHYLKPSSVVWDGLLLLCIDQFMLICFWFFSLQTIILTIDSHMANGNKRAISKIVIHQRVYAWEVALWGNGFVRWLHLGSTCTCIFQTDHKKSNMYFIFLKVGSRLHIYTRILYGKICLTHVPWSS